MHHQPTGPSLAIHLRTALIRAWHGLSGRPRLLAALCVVLAGVGTALAVPRPTSVADASETAPIEAAATGSASPATADDGAGDEDPATADDGAGDEDPAADQEPEPEEAGDAPAPDEAPPAQDDADPAAADKGDGEDAAAEEEAAAVNPNCSLTVPADPTSVSGLTTPYQLSATDRKAGPCHETDPDQSAFVEAAIIDPANGDISIYHPLVVDEGTAPAMTPAPVTLPAGAVVGVWFGSNGDTLTLDGPGAAQCTNGLPDSPFGQFAYCNAPAFFSAAYDAISAGRLTVPALGTGRDGQPCPTSRDFSVVDQDQSDNLATIYRVVGGRMAQDTAATRSGKLMTNGSDEGLLARAIDPALGCTPFRAPDLSDGGALTPALALNELSAAVHQGTPAALTPTSDPMTRVNDRPSVAKTNLYRAGVGQPALPAGQNPQAYCKAMVDVGATRIELDRALFKGAASPDPASDDLYEFLTTRLQDALGLLGCDPGRN
jgi:hypothetical protein